MDDNLITKKELLELTGISYGALYRWKRMKLLPDDWFIHRSTFTGHETFFPRDKVLERVKQIQQMKKEIEENKASNAPMVPAYNHFKEETEELNRIFADAYNFSFQYSEPKVDGMQIRRAMNISFTADSFDHAVSMLHEVVEGSYRCLIEDLSIQDDEDLEDEELKDIRIHPVAVTFQLTYFETRYDAESEEGLDLEPEETQAPSGLANADVSNLQRSDLETAAEAALGE